MPDALNAAWYMSLAAEGVALGRLLYLRLPFPWFKVYLAANLLQSILLLLLGGTRETHAYDVVWVSSEPLLLLLVCGVAIEVCTKIRASFPGLGRFGQYLIAGFSTLAAIICYFSIGPELHGADWQRPVLTWAIVAKRSVSTVGFIVLFMVSVCVTITPSRIAPNVRTRAKLLCGYLAIPAIGICVALLRIFSSREVSIGMLSAATICFVGWALLLNEEGEVRPPADYPETQAELDASWNVVRTLFEAIEGVFR